MIRVLFLMTLSFNVIAQKIPDSFKESEKKIPELDKESMKEVDAMLKGMKEQKPEKKELPGHNKPLGASLKPLKIAERSDMPNPIEFFDDYVKLSRPVVMRGVAKIYPNFEKFKSDEFLAEKFGDWVVDVETAKKEDILKSSYSMSFKNFTLLYKNEDIYLLTDIEKLNKIAKMTHLPKCLLCADFLRGINSCYMQMSSGGTTSYLRRDGYDQFLCQYDGSTTYTVANKRYHNLIKLTEEEYCDIDVDKVNMKKNPDLSKVPWYRATLNAGDCMYIPYRWYFQQRASKKRNIHIGTYFCPIVELFSRKGCIKKMKKIPKRVSWSKFNAADEEISNKKRLIALFADVPQPFDFQTFYEILFSEMPTGAQLDETQMLKIFKEIDANGDGLIKYVDIYKGDNTVLGPLYYVFHGTIQETVETATGIQQYSQELLNQMEDIKAKTDEQELKLKAEKARCEKEQAAALKKQSLAPEAEIKHQNKEEKKEEKKDEL